MSRWRRNLAYVEGEDIQPANMNKASVEKYATDIARIARFQIGQDPAYLVKLLGGRIHIQPLGDWATEDGSIFVHGEADFDILLSSYTSPLRDRFTVSHELGHYFLHSNCGETQIIAHRKGSTRIEWEANWFAASLLMPADSFRDCWNQHKDLPRIAAIFGVSEDAARVRHDAICGI